MDGNVSLWCLWRCLWGNLASQRVVFATMTIEMRGAVKLLSALLALEDSHLVEERVTIEVVRPVKPLPTDLAEEDLVVRVRVGENVLLEQVLARESQTTNLARYSNVLPVSFDVDPISA